MTGAGPGRARRWRRTRALLVAAAATLALAVAVAVGSRSGPAELLEWRSVDLRFRLRGDLAPDPEIVIVAVDEESFRRLGLRYPFPPRVWAELVQRLERAGAGVAAFDFLYSEPTRECDPPDQDRLLAESVRAAGNVIWGLELGEGERPLPPIAPIREAVAGLGFLNLPDERDGRIRRFAVERSGVPGFAAAVVEAYAGYLPPQWRQAPLHLIAYRGGPETYPTVSLAQVLAGELPDELFAGRICLVGATFAASHDTFATPFHRVDAPDMAGVEIHANAIGTMLRGRPLALSGLGWGWLVLAAATLAIALLVTADRPWLAALLQAAAIAGWGAWAIERFLSGEVIPVVAPVALLLLAHPTTAFFHSLAVRRERGEIRRLFESYVDPAVVRWLLDNPDAVRLTGGRYAVTILESDIEGFTPITERLAPEDLVAHLNRYFELLTGAVIDAGGMHDKYVGDALLAVFGFPLAQPDHTERAVRAAVDMIDRVERHNPEWERQGLPALRTRIGLATGEVVIGTVGGSARKTFTAIGEAVNLAARLEGLNKDLGTRILLDRPTAEAVAGSIPLRDLGEHRVKGFTRPVRVFTPRTREPDGENGGRGTTGPEVG